MHLPDRDRIAELWRFGQAGAANALFGFGAYALFVWLGLDIYLAQIVATVLGVTFNYFTYSQHVFREASAAKARFALSYVGNYLISVAALAAAAQVVRSPYAAGAIAIVAAAAINYFVLKYLVFTRAASS